MRWCGKKRKADAPAEAVHMSDEDDSDTPLPFILPKLMASNSIYSHGNHLYFNDDITYESVFQLNKELRALENKLRMLAIAQNMDPQPIYLHITTYGGCIHGAFSVVDCIQSLKVPVYTIADGFVASAGTLITLAGEKRYIAPNAYMLIHELRSGVWGKMTSIDEEYSNLKKVMAHIMDYYQRRTHMSKKDLEKILVKDFIWNSKESIDRGLVEEVYSG